MTTGSLRVPATGALADLLACPPPLLDVTLDQLRTLLAVSEAGSPLAASRILGREHSSVRKQLDTLNHAFQQICGETLVVKQGRGRTTCSRRPARPLPRSRPTRSPAG